jgi:aerobic-type carbon monoxide dehydrogenase small subunit (CoxS/CutS family)
VSAVRLSGTVPIHKARALRREDWQKIANLAYEVQYFLTAQPAIPMGAANLSDAWIWVVDMVSLRVNGVSHHSRSDPATPLIFVLRNELGLMGTKLGCGLEQCGACAVLVDGSSVLSCNAPVAQFEGRNIETVEAQGNPLLERVRAAFVAAGAAQCGYCIPGMVIAAAALLRATPRPDDRAIREALRPHLCRCGTQARVLRAVRTLAQEGASA